MYIRSYLCDHWQTFLCLATSGVLLVVLCLACSQPTADEFRADPMDAESVGSSIGKIDDPQLLSVPEPVIRFYYDDPSATLSQQPFTNSRTGNAVTCWTYGTKEGSAGKTNVQDDNTVLFYDYYPPQLQHEQNNRVCVLFFHAGGYAAGRANMSYRGYYENGLKRLREDGYHVVSIEYRRGWYDDGSTSPPQYPPNNQVLFDEDDARRFRQVVEDAYEDGLQAWSHIQLNTMGHARYASALDWTQDPPATAALGVSPYDGQTYYPFDNKYVLMGWSAGGSMAARLALTHLGPREDTGDTEILGVISGYGTFGLEESPIEAVIDRNNDDNEHTRPFPVIIQGNMFDNISPLYDNHIYHSSLLPMAKGIVTLYEDCVALGYPSRLYMHAQRGHGPWMLSDDALPMHNYVVDAFTMFMAYHNAGSIPETLANFSVYEFDSSAATSFSGATFDIDDAANCAGPYTGQLYERLGDGGKKWVMTKDHPGLEYLSYPLDDVEVVTAGFEYDCSGTNNATGQVISVPTGRFRYEPFETHWQLGEGPADHCTTATYALPFCQ